MSLISRRNLIQRLRRGKQSRESLVESNLGEGIAYQIRATRDKRGWTQERLAEETGMTQTNISRLESPEYGKYSITSLTRLAHAFDAGLVVRFVPFGQYVNWLSGTPSVDEGLNPDALAVPSFEDQEAGGVLEERELNEGYIQGFEANVQVGFVYNSAPQMFYPAQEINPQNTFVFTAPKENILWSGGRPQSLANFMSLEMAPLISSSKTVSSFYGHAMEVPCGDA